MKFLTVFSMLILGCEGSVTQQQMLPLDQCLTGWYLQPPEVPCSIVVTCKSSPMFPECSHLDCVQWEFIGFQGALYYEGRLTYSPEAKSMSGTMETLQYHKTDTGYQVGQGVTGTFDVMECTASEMTTNMNMVMRPSDSFSSALSRATANQAEVWVATPVS